ncbi:endo alpha-1,4 polygalactosaminidase [Streptomyces melanosporofaciens]|uniref:Glycoside-hydrolase family GH114 n=1 Tax=Streptomyces melanosporofaciens TaxID=67327 RepID=A0A1H4LQL6_STRMJ|nr:endo alpha-1,4 polygalactosaminidase [Streptomyces melanosporofaciens]SEB72928.1 Glycoside-hydrolase family GH114 [Streptomyces melanosporofaciens]
MPASHAARLRRRWVLASVATAASAAAAVVAVSMSSGANASEVALPPAHGGFDYQIGGEYTPPKGVDIVSRDRADSPAAGLYNICYVNAFQVQPGERDQWPDDLLLRDSDGDLVIDTHWKEPLLDISTAKKRERVAEKVNGWIDGCAEDGFDAVEPDNYDSYERSQKLLTTTHAKEFMALLSEHAHAQGLAIAQKNTAELLADRKAAGLDFAVVEECGQYDECGEFAKAYDDHVVVVEYGEEGFAEACEGWGDRLSIVLRDEDVSTDDGEDYVRETC